MMITPLGTGGGCHVSVMVVKVLLKAWSPTTGPTAKYKGTLYINVIMEAQEETAGVNVHMQSVTK